jgi:hypothetical protein
MLFGGRTPDFRTVFQNGSDVCFKIESKNEVFQTIRFDKILHSTYYYGEWQGVPIAAFMRHLPHF